MPNDSKLKIGPDIHITKSGKQEVFPGVTVENESRFYGLKGQYTIGDEDNNVKISGRAGKGSGRTDVKHPGGKEVFKGQGDTDWNIGIKWTKKFSNGGGVAIQGTKFNGVK